MSIRLRTFVGVATIALVGGCTTTDHVTENAERDVPPLTESSLDRVLVSDATIQDITGFSHLSVRLRGSKLLTRSDDYSDVECASAIDIGEKTAYAGSGWTDVRRLITDSGFGTQSEIDQAAVLFGSADEAREFLQASRSRWETCANTTVTEKRGRSTVSYELGPVGGDAVVTLTYKRDYDRGSECQHALGALSNVIAESVVCAQQISDEGKNMVIEMLKNAEGLARLAGTNTN